MSPELQSLILALSLVALSVTTVYALIIRIRLWFYERLLSTIKEVVSSPLQSSVRPNHDGSLGCGLNLMIALFLLLLIGVIFILTG